MWLRIFVDGVCVHNITPYSVTGIYVQFCFLRFVFVSFHMIVMMNGVVDFVLLSHSGPSSIMCKSLYSRLAMVTLLLLFSS
jgi:hypothetical protein